MQGLSLSFDMTNRTGDQFSSSPFRNDTGMRRLFSWPLASRRLPVVFFLPAPASCLMPVPYRSLLLHSIGDKLNHVSRRIVHVRAALTFHAFFGRSAIAVFDPEITQV